MALRSWKHSDEKGKKKKKKKKKRGRVTHQRHCDSNDDKRPKVGLDESVTPQSVARCCGRSRSPPPSSSTLQ